MRISEKPNKFYIIRKVLMRAIQKCSFIEFGLLCKKLWSFFLSNFGSHQIWSCHETQNASFENFLFCLILHLISEKVTQFLVKKLSASEVTSQKPLGGWKTPLPSAFRVNLSSVHPFCELLSSHSFI